MKYVMALALVFFNFNYSLSQIKVEGLLRDQDQKPISFALVSISETADSTKIRGDLSNDQGSFSFEQLTPGAYRLDIQMLGYVDTTFQLTLKKDTSLPAINLKLETQALDAIEVVAERSVLKSELGKKVLLIGQDLSSTGTTAMEALENIPSVQTNPRGQVQIRGSSDVIIFINGKETRRDPSTLKYISADQLQKIEVITVPGASYDAEGVGGIVNLVFRKGRKSKFELEAVYNSTLYSNPLNYNPNVGLNASLTKNNFSIYTNVSYDFGKYEDKSGTLRTPLMRAADGYENSNRHHGLGSVTNYNLGVEYEIDTSWTVGMELNFHRWDFTTSLEQKFIFELIGDDQSVMQNSDQEELEDELWINFSTNKEIGSDGEISLMLSAGGENEANSFQADPMESNTVPEAFDQFLLYSTEREAQRYYQGQLNYENKFFHFGKIKSGLKLDLVDYNIFQKVQFGSQEIQVPNNEFEMTMQKLGIFVEQSNQFKRLEYAIGLRVEQFSSEALQRSDGNTFDQKYLRLFPSVQMNILLPNQTQTLGMSYSKRINRPGFFDINPYVSYADPLNLETGNPNLLPEIADVLEVAYHKSFESVIVDATLFRRLTSDAIQYFIQDAGAGKTIRSTDNIGRLVDLGLESQIEYHMSKALKFTAAVVWRKSNFEDTKKAITFNGNRTWRVNLKQQWLFKKNWKFESSFIYRAPQFQIQQREHEMFYFNLAIGKKLNNNKGRISLSIRDLFNTQLYAYTLINSEFEVYRFYKWQTRRIDLGLQIKLINNNENN